MKKTVIICSVILLLATLVNVAIAQDLPAPAPTPPQPASPAPAVTPPAPVTPTPPAPVTPTPPAPITPTPPAPPKPVTPEEKPLPANGITEKEITDLITKLSSDDLMVMNAARDELKEIGRPAVPPLIKALATAKPDVRYLICEILGEIRDPGSVETLVKLLDDKDEHAASVASAAARALRYCADLSVIPHLMRVVTSTDVDLRYEAVKTLGVLRAYQALPVVRRMVTDTAKTSLEYYVKAAAVQTLGKLKDRASARQLIGLLDNTDIEPATDEPFVKYIIKALEQITGFQAGAFSRMDDKKKDAVVKKWKEWWEKNSKDYE
ncbi:MAG: HEAT repeat domain-containing protein [Planctomycetota bacterium]